jgi:glutamate 5-kinase
VRFIWPATIAGLGTPVSTEVVHRGFFGECGTFLIADVISIQGDFSKGDVLHVWRRRNGSGTRPDKLRSGGNDVDGAHMLDCKTLSVKRKSDVIAAANMLVLEENHLFDALEGRPASLYLCRRSK